MIKKKYLAMLTSFQSLEGGIFHIQRLTYQKISENFEKVFIINSQNLRFFPNFACKYYMEKKYTESNFEPPFLPKNFILFNPKNLKEFSDFLNDKELIIINHINKHFFDLKIQMLIKKYKFKQIQISNLGVEGAVPQTTSKEFKHFFKTMLFYLNQQLFNKITVLLTNFGIVPKLDVRFFSNLKHLDNIKKNKFKNFLHKKKFLWAKEIKLVNSMAYDIFLENKLQITDKYIVHLDAGLNIRHEVELRGLWPKDKVIKHYYYLEKFLKRLSKEFGKEVIVTIHPGYDLQEHQHYLKNFKVLKYKTTEYIYKSFMITSFESSAITDGILLKKKILGLHSDFMSENEIFHSHAMARNVGYTILNTKKDYNFNKEKLLLEMKQNVISNYENYISKYHCFKPNISGSQEIVDTIKERFFKK
jgi:hypothetical protein